MNLIINAEQAIVAGGSVQITAKAVVGKGNEALVQIDIGDTGPGMSPEVASRVFDPFFTTKEPGKGTGMGLTVAHGIVTAHGGSIELTTGLEKGCTFSVLFPQNARPVSEEGPDS